MIEVEKMKSGSVSIICENRNRQNVVIKKLSIEIACGIQSNIFFLCFDCAKDLQRKLAEATGYYPEVSTQKVSGRVRREIGIWEFIDENK